MKLRSLVGKYLHSHRNHRGRLSLGCRRRKAGNRRSRGSVRREGMGWWSHPKHNPIGSMGLVYLPTVWLIYMVNVGKYITHGWYGNRWWSHGGTKCPLKRDHFIKERLGLWFFSSPIIFFTREMLCFRGMPMPIYKFLYIWTYNLTTTHTATSPLEIGKLAPNSSSNP